MEYDDIKEQLTNIRRAIDRIGERDLRQFIDAQIVIIYRKGHKMDTKVMEQESKEAWYKLND